METVERQFWCKVKGLKDLNNITDDALQAVERLMKFLNGTSISLSTQATSLLKERLGAKLNSESMNFTSKMLKKEGVDLNHGIKEEKKEQKKEQKKQKKKDNIDASSSHNIDANIKTIEDCDAFGFLDLFRELRNCVSNKVDTSTMMECFVAFLE